MMTHKEKHDKPFLSNSTAIDWSDLEQSNGSSIKPQMESTVQNSNNQLIINTNYLPNFFYLFMFSRDLKKLDKIVVSQDVCKMSLHSQHSNNNNKRNATPV